MDINKDTPKARFDGTMKLESGVVTFTNRHGRQIVFYPFASPTIVLQNMYNSDSLFINSQEKFDQLWEKLEELFKEWYDT